MGEDAGLVIRRTAAEEPAVAFDGGEGVGFPQRQVAGGLDIVVGIQQNRRLARVGRAARDDGGSAGRPVLLVAAEDPDVVETAGPDEAGDGVGAAVQRGRIKAWPGDARNGNKVRQLADRFAERFGNSLAEGFGIDGAGVVQGGLRVPRGR